MKTIIALISIMLLSTICFADEFKLAWDYDQAQEQNITGFRIYSGPMGQNEAGEWIPKFGTDPISDNIPATDRIVTVTENGWPAASKKFCFSARAFRGDEESADARMADGEYLCVIIDNTPLIAPADVAGNFDADASMINLSWAQEAAGRAKFWQIYYRIGGSEFALLGRVDNAGQQDLKMTTAFDAVPPGSVSEVGFVIVAYKNFDVFSPNSQTALITVDRRGEVTAPENFRFELMIPVQ